MTQKNSSRPRRLRRPSRTVAVATVAALLAGGGTAIAAKSITSKDIKNGTIKLVDVSAAAQSSLRGNTGPAGPAGPRGAQGAPGAPATALFATVSAAGGLVHGPHATGVTKQPVIAGAYVVTFDRDVSGCAYSATIGGSVVNNVPAGQISAAPRGGAANAVFVGTYDGAAGDADQAFSLAVFC
jgi:hypothetical protein